MKKKKQKTKNRYALKNKTFTFVCNETVPCFTRCCHEADMFLYPYDIIRLKNRLDMTSDEFLVTHTDTAFRQSRYFPSVMLKMSDEKGRPCPFLSDHGCTVYEDRPYSCRAYPLEPVIHGNDGFGFSIESFIVRHDHCLGHDKGNQWTADQWMKDQGMTLYNEYNSAWARVAALLFKKKPAGRKGADNPAMNMAYMASFNMDTFRRFVFESSFLERFDVPSHRIKDAEKNDTALMMLGFDWILRFLGGQGPLKAKK